WANKDMTIADHLPEPLIHLYKQSTLVIRTQVDNRGSIIAGNDSDVLRFNRDTYSYLWPRDGALVANALDLAGYGEVTRRFFYLCGELMTRDGYLLHKYNPDGSLGSSWHAWSTPDGRRVGRSLGRARLRRRVRAARPLEALRDRGRGDQDGGPREPLRRGARAIRAHDHRPAGRHHHEGCDARHVDRRHLPLRDAPG